MSTAADAEARARRAMVALLRTRGVADERVLETMSRVPRHEFVPDDLRFEAYSDRALPIGHQQTISQPQMVAVMLEALELEGDEKVLEVGTGSGYEAALLAELAREVLSIEVVPDLAERARETLERLGVRNVEVRLADGSLGAPDAAPFDAIVVAADAPRVPASLVGQLADGGRLVVPVEGVLTRVRRFGDGTTRESLGWCAFVPLVGEEGFARRPARGAHWSHFEHGADIGVRGVGPTLAIAFEQAALALFAVVTDPGQVSARRGVQVSCEAPDPEMLLVDFLNALITQMSTRSLVLGHVDVRIEGSRLEATAWGEPVDALRHAPAVEPKGATYTALSVRKEDGLYVAECVVDV